MPFNQNEILLFKSQLQGGEKSFEQLYNAYVKTVMRLCFFITQDFQQAQEACMDTFLTLWNKKEAVAQMDMPQAWLYQTAKNIAHNTVRKNLKHTKRIILLDDDEDEMKIPEEILNQLEKEDLHDEIENALKKLPSRQVQVIRLKLEELDRQSIAKKTNLSEATIKNHITMAYKKLKSFLRRPKDE